MEPTWTTACPDWEQRIVAGKSILPVGALFPIEAADAMTVFGGLRLVDVIGQPLMRDIAKPWVMDLAQVLFGAYDVQSGQRLINEYFVLISKKNGKSTIAAALMLTALVMNRRRSAEFIVLAPTKEIADNSYLPMRDMVQADPNFTAVTKVQDHIRTITDRRTGSMLKVVAADSDTVTGKKATGVFIDELHEFGKRPRAGSMLLEATGGLAARPEGFIIYATTQSSEPPAGAFKQKLTYARKVRDGEVENKRFLPVLFEFPRKLVEAAAYEDLDNAYITNPNLGASVDLARLQQLHDQAQEGGSDALIDFRAKYLNVEVGLNLRDDRWAGADYWKRATDNTLTLDELLDRSDVVVAGVDGGGLDDLLGLALIGRDAATGDWMVWSHAWAHESVLRRRKEIAPRLHDFSLDGDLTIVQNLGDDVRELAAILANAIARGLLPKKEAIGLDQIGIDFKDDFAAAGIDCDLLVGIAQGFRLTGTIATLERRLAAGTCKHIDSAMLAWCVSNAKVVARGNAQLITKEASGKAKIDPLMAVLDAAQLMALNPVAGAGRIMQGFVAL